MSVLRIISHSLICLWGLRCSISIGMVIGWVCSRLLKAPKKLRPHIICCIATGELIHAMLL